jgi:hypothetical protein
MAYSLGRQFADGLVKYSGEISGRKDVEIVPSGLPHETTKKEKVAVGGCSGRKGMAVSWEGGWRRGGGWRDTGLVDDNGWG